MRPIYSVVRNIVAISVIFLQMTVSYVFVFFEPVGSPSLELLGVQIFLIIFINIMIIRLTARSLVSGSASEFQKIYTRPVAIAFILVNPVMFVCMFAYVYRVLGLIDLTGNVTKESVNALYFSIVTWSTLGYGDFRPTEGARLFAAVEAIIGYIYMAFLISVMFKFWSELNRGSKN